MKSGQNENSTRIEEAAEGDTINCQDYFNEQEALVLKITGAESDQTSIEIKYQNEKIQVNDLDITEVKSMTHKL